MFSSTVSTTSDLSSSEGLVLNSNGGYIPFEETKLPQSVCIAQINQQIVNRSILYCVIPSWIKESYNNGEVMSLRQDGQIKGLNGKCFPNGTILDIYYNGKQKHTTFFSTGKIKICGASSHSDGRVLADIVCKILNDANEYIRQIYLNFDLYKSAFKWLLENSKGADFNVHSFIESKKNSVFGLMRFCKLIPAQKIEWPKIVPDEYIDIIEDFRLRSYDLLFRYEATYEALSERVTAILNTEPIDDIFEIKSITCPCIIRWYYLGFKIDRYILQELLSDEGFDVHFPCTSSSEVIVYVEDENDDVIGKEKFIFFPGGSIKHSGYLDILMEKNYNEIMSVLCQIQDKIKIKR